MMFLKRILLALVLAMPVIEACSQSITILTYNIRYDNPDDGPNAWPLRKTWLCEQIRSANPGIFGIQEGLGNQVMYIDSIFSEYRHIGVGRDDGKRKGEFSAIWFNPAKFKMIRQGTFWLSATPGKCSMGWDAACKRICTHGLFLDIATGKHFWVFNTHFDHIGVQARKNSAILILKKMKSLNKNGYPIILMGDFNSGPETEAYKIITEKLQDSKIADKSMMMGPEGTFNGFYVSKPAIERIDFIFTSKKGITLLNYGVLRETREGRFASDHFPVITDVQLNRQ